MTIQQKDATSYWTNKIISGCMAVAIAVTSWFLNQAWERINNVEAAVHQLEISSATTAGNRFSSSDWTKAKELLDTERLSLDRRIMRLEESLPVIKDSLLQINQSIREINLEK